MKKQTKKIRNIAGASLVILAVLVGLYFALGIGQVIFAPTFTPVYCNDYSFTFCADQVDYAQNFKLDTKNALICPNTATYCKVISATQNYDIGSGNCHYWGGVLGAAATWVCDNRRNAGAGAIAQPGEYLYSGLTHALPSTIQIEIHKNQLVFTGRGTNVQGGVNVKGATGCTFNPGATYDASGRLLTLDPSETSYTVPVGQCLQTYAKGDRHVCANLEEQCKVNTDCAGHTYGNKECVGRSLNTYGCNTLGASLPSGIVTIGGEKVIPFGSETGTNFGTILTSRCEITSAQSVQCCGDNDCGANAFCDTNPASSKAWTCQAKVQCSQNSDCGVSAQCDINLKQIKTPKCSAGQCSYSTQNVQCCNDNMCAAGQFCDIDNNCKQKAITKLDCPSQCCVGIAQYTDKPCANGLFCIAGTCSSNGCTSSTDCPSGKVCSSGNCIDDKELTCKFWQKSYTKDSSSFFGLFKSQTTGCKTAGWFIAVIIGLIVLFIIMVWIAIMKAKAGLIRRFRK